MKQLYLIMRNYRFSLVILTFFLLIISGCITEISREVTYHGVVHNSVTDEPFVDLPVKVTDGEHIHTQTKTDQAGEFTIVVKINEINSGYYILVGDETCDKKKVVFPSFAEGINELGIIIVDGPHVPTVETSKVFSFDATTLRCGGKVIDNGRLPVTDRGICYSKMTYPTIDDEKHSEGKGNGEFTCVIKNLTIGASYYFRAYATNQEGTSYGTQYQVTMADGLPQVSISPISQNDIKATSAIISGEVTSDGGFDITERGFVWADHQLPTLQDHHVTDNGKIGKYSLALSPLSLLCHYYVRAYATNSTGTAYSDLQRDFTTTNGRPSVTTNQPSATASSIEISGEVNDDGGFPITECGICYSTSTNQPTISGQKVISENVSGVFYVTISGLSTSTEYYLRAYAKNNNGISYGESRSISTNNGVASISLGAITEITAKTAMSSIIVDNAGGGTLQSCGVCWSTNPIPTTQDFKKEAGGAQINTSYNCKLSGLVPSTKYYIRAYATTEFATSYSEPPISFTTTSGKPSVKTEPNNYDSGLDYLVITGSASTEEDAPIIRQGVCWSINANPSISDGIVVSNSNTSPFSCRIEGLQSSTTYYCRAFAENSYGLSYGASYGFSTSTPPTTLSGYVYDQDGKPIANANVSGYDVSGYFTQTDNNGYYSITWGKYGSGDYQFISYATDYNEQIKTVTIKRGQDNHLDFNLTLTNSFAVDFGDSFWHNPMTAWELYFECSQSSLAGKTTTRNMRIKNYRSVSVPWSLSNVPSSGISFYPQNGTIPANGEVAIKVTFIYPDTSAYKVTLTGCNNGSKAYIWNWEYPIGGLYVMNGVGYEAPCSACCYHTPIITVDNYSEGFTLLFNQFVTYR